MTKVQFAPIATANGTLKMYGAPPLSVVPSEQLRLQPSALGFSPPAKVIVEMMVGGGSGGDGGGRNGEGSGAEGEGKGEGGRGGGGKGGDGGDGAGGEGDGGRGLGAGGADGSGGEGGGGAGLSPSKFILYLECGAS